MSDLTDTEISVMAHALGYSLVANSWPVEPYRNGWAGSDARWERLIDAELAYEREIGRGIGIDVYYHVTDRGRELLLHGMDGTAQSCRGFTMAQVRPRRSRSETCCSTSRAPRTSGVKKNHK